MTIKTRKIGSLEVFAIGVGCRGLSGPYGSPPSEIESTKLLNQALDLGYNLFDTAALYGFGDNEKLLGRILKSRRHECVLASKCGIFKNSKGQRELDARPETLIKTCNDSLRRLKTDVIDLYYLHRWDQRVPIDESIGALKRLVEAGKIKEIGVSEVSAKLLLEAHRKHSISAIQSEYSLWTRNAEIKVLDTCKSIGSAFVAFSPLGRGFLTGSVRDSSKLAANDLRLTMPRFQDKNLTANLRLLDGYTNIARENNCSMAQLGLAWLLAQSDHIIPIPGATTIQHLEENVGAINVELSNNALDRLNALINQNTVSGPRYGSNVQRELDTEEFT